MDQHGDNESDRPEDENAAEEGGSGAGDQGGPKDEKPADKKPADRKPGDVGRGQPGFRSASTPGPTPGAPTPGGSGNPLEDLLGPLLGGAGLGGLGGGAAGLGNLGGLGGLGGPGGPQFDPQMLGAVMGQLQKFLANPTDSPVNWQVAHDLARQAAAQSGDPTPGDADRRAVDDALRVSELWLDGVTEFASAGASTEAWSRAEWVEHTMPVWRQLVEPVATNVATAMGDAMAAQAPPEMAAMLGSASAMLRQVGGGVFGMQVGQAIGTLAGEVLSSTDIGLPLAPAGRAALLPANVTAFAEGLEVPLDEVRRYLALREAAHQRLFAHVPWLRAHLLGTVETFARGIHVDGDRIAEAARQVDPGNPESLQEALSSGIFEPQNTPEQQAALTRLESALALVEGWVDHVVDAAAAAVLPHAAALRETVRRRRATGGPAEHAFSVLVGLELRPRRAREAAVLWAQLEQAGGRSARDAVWAHPDLLPTEDDLTAPEGFVARRTGGGAGSDGGEGDEMDAALRELLDGGTPGAGKPDGDEPRA